MYIAICDDNVADRKQSERLIKRETDRRAAADGMIYCDSYGSAASLLANPMRYDAYFLDICHSPAPDIREVIHTLRENGMNSPIILCSSLIDYSALEGLEGYLLFLQKPIKVAELTSIFDEILHHKSNEEPLIELRTEEASIYVKEQEILYAVSSGRQLELTLTQDRHLTTLDTAQNFYAQLEKFETFFLANKNTVLNGRYLEKLRFPKVIMKDGSSFSVSISTFSYAKKVLAYFQPSNLS